MLKRVSLAVVLALLTAAVLSAQVITASHQLTAGQRAAVQRLVDAENARRAAQDPPGTPITVQQYADSACRAPFKDYVDAEDEQAVTTAALKDRFKRASPAQRAAALAQLPSE